MPNSSLGHSTTSTGYFARSAAMARYDLSVSPHSLATFTKSTGFPAKLEKSTRRPDRAVAWNWCSCIDAGAVVLSLIIKRECPASAALPKCAYRAFALLGGTNTQEWQPTQLIYFQKIVRPRLARRPTLGRARVCLRHSAYEYRGPRRLCTLGYGTDPPTPRIHALFVVPSQSHKVRV